MMLPLDVPYKYMPSTVGHSYYHSSIIYIQDIVSPPQPQADLILASMPIIRFTNARLVRGEALVAGDLYIDSAAGTILSGPDLFYSSRPPPEAITTIDLRGRILAPGLIDAQLNGVGGVDFSVPAKTPADYVARLAHARRVLIAHGVTAFVPTVTSQPAEIYAHVLPLLAADRKRRGGRKARSANSPVVTAVTTSGGPGAETGGFVPRASIPAAESLGAHVEGPFLNPLRHGIHRPSLFRAAASVADLESVYGGPEGLAALKVVTVAPEVGVSEKGLETGSDEGVGGMLSLIPALVARGITVAIGHSDATLDQGEAAVAMGATMVTHLFNAMRAFHHREPGLLGLLLRPLPPPPMKGDQQRGQTQTQIPPAQGLGHGRSQSAGSYASIQSADSEQSAISTSPSHSADPRPFFGLVADGVHLHPATVRLARAIHPTGLVLVTDAMSLAGMPDGVYDWTNGDRIRKRDGVLTLVEEDDVAEGKGEGCGRIGGKGEMDEAVQVDVPGSGAGTPGRLATPSTSAGSGSGFGQVTPASATTTTAPALNARLLSHNIISRAASRTQQSPTPPAAANAPPSPTPNTTTPGSRSGRIAGSAATLIDCVNNFRRFTGIGAAAALAAATDAPARMLGLAGVKGCLEAGADADLVVLSEVDENDGGKMGTVLKVDEVWKGGVRMVKHR